MRAVCRNVGLILLWPLTALAEGTRATEEKPPVVREEISVVALAWEESVEELPYAVERIEAEELRAARALHGVPDTVEAATAVAVQRTSGAQASPYLRGLTGFRTLLALDGVRLNSATLRDGPNQYWASVDPYLAESIEVARGPFSVLHGSDAVGGTVELRTPELFAGEADERRRASLFLVGGLADESGAAHVEWRGGGERFRYLVGATAQSVGDVEAAGEVGRQPRTGFDQGSWSFKGEYRPSAAGRLVVAAQADRIDDAWRAHRTIHAVRWEGTSAGSELVHAFDQRRDLAYVRWADQRRTAAWDGFDATVSWSRLGEDRDRVRGDGRRDLSGFDAGTLGAALRFRRERGHGALGYGIELSRERVDSASRAFRADGNFAGAAVLGPVADEATYDVAGIYLQRELAPSDRWRLVAGGRWSYAAADAGRVQDPVTGAAFALEDAWSQATGDVRALVRLDCAGRWRLWGGVAQGFRAPNLSDLTRLDVARSGEIETPSPGLEPERFLTYELGLRRSGVRGRAELVLFWNDLDGLIVRAPTGRTLDGDAEVTKRNAGDGRLYGVELDVTRRFGESWSARLSGSWLRGTIETYERGPELAAEPLDKLPPHRARLALRRSWGRRGVVESAAAWVDRADRLSTRDRSDAQRIPPGGTPGYVLVDLRGELELRPGLRLGLALENLLDEQYRVHGSGQNGPGRNLVASVELDF